jgi:murein DD-endopeptidase MepM/ murein hydrolase activator NlpD
VTAYVVQSGDTLASIAERFGLRRETLVWSNPELAPDPTQVYPGQVLNILPVDGVYHLVSEGETLASIAQQYQVSTEAIVCFRGNWNALDQDGILGCADPLAPEMTTGTVPVVGPGTALIIPGGVKTYQPTFVRFQTGRIVRETPEAERRFVWPARWPISQEYWDLHRAIDIAGEHGEVVVAAEAGIVTYAEWEISGYGYLVVVDHGEGLVSYYGHLYGFYVDVGQSVRRGQPLGVIGNTGHSTGPHLHFEVRCDGVPCDPYAYLPPE